MGVNLMPIKNDNEIYYTVKDLVNLLNLTEITIRDYLKKGKLRGNKGGRKWYISKADLGIFLRGGTKKRFLGVF